MDSPETVKIKKSDLEALVKASMTLDALNGGGVDNWGGYGEALYEDYGDGCTGDEIKRPDFFEVYCTPYLIK
jgi:hypothetical protein